MRKIQYVFFLFVVVVYACHSRAKTTSGSDSKCLTEKIEAFSKQECKTGASVKEYVLAGQHVYAFEPGNCGADMTTEVVDSACKNLGYLGGITGNRTINDQDFSSAELVKTWWESPAY